MRSLTVADFKKLINSKRDLLNTLIFFLVAFFILLFFWAGRICFVPNFWGIE